MWLTRARNFDKRDRIHLAQTYRLLGRGLTSFHVLDISRQTNRYNDAAIPRENLAPLYYPRTTLSPTITDDSVRYTQVENTVGVLGATELVEYRLYGRHRLANLDAVAGLTRAST